MVKKCGVRQGYFNRFWLRLGEAFHSLSLIGANIFMIRSLKELCYAEKKRSMTLWRTEKNTTLSHWLRLINSSTFQVFITLLCVLGNRDVRGKKHQGKASGTVFSVCFLNQEVCCDKTIKSLYWNQNIFVPSCLNTNALKMCVKFIGDV